MSKMFQNNAGRIAIVRGVGLPAVISVQGFKPTMAMINHIAVSEGANVQIQPSLRRAIYVYSFGDKIGAVQVGGVAFISRGCPSGPSGDGTEDVFAFYAKNRVSRRLRHVNITLGQTTFAGFLTKISMQSQKAEHRFFRYSLEFAAVPNFEGLAAGQGSTGSGGENQTNSADDSSDVEGSVRNFTLMHETDVEDIQGNGP